MKFTLRCIEMKTLVTVLIVTLSISLSAQSGISHTPPVRVGLGAAFLGTGDVLVPKIEVEKVWFLNRSFDLGLSLNLGHVNYTQSQNSIKSRTIVTTVHFDQTVYLNLFNSRKIQLAIGVGTSLMYVNDVWGNIIEEASGDYEDLDSDTRTSVGGQVIPELRVVVSKGTKLYLRGIIQPYFNYDISSGLSIGLLF